MSFADELRAVMKSAKSNEQIAAEAVVLMAGEIHGYFQRQCVKAAGEGLASWSVNVRYDAPYVDPYQRGWGVFMEPESVKEKFAGLKYRYPWLTSRDDRITRFLGEYSGGIESELRRLLAEDGYKEFSASFGNRAVFISAEW